MAKGKLAENRERVLAKLSEKYGNGLFSEAQAEKYLKSIRKEMKSDITIIGLKKTGYIYVAADGDIPQLKIDRTKYPGPKKTIDDFL